MISYSLYQIVNPSTFSCPIKPGQVRSSYPQLANELKVTK